MKNCALFLVIFCCVIMMFCCACCIHDLRTLRAYNVRLQEGMMQLASEQKEQAKEMRVMKTNNDIVFNMVINKEWENE